MIVITLIGDIQDIKLIYNNQIVLHIP